VRAQAVDPCLPVPAGPRRGADAGASHAAGLLEGLFEPCCLLVICMILCVGSIVASAVYVGRTEEVICRMSRMRDELDRRMDLVSNLCRQTRAYVDEEMPKYDVSGDLEVMNERLDVMESYTRETRRYVEWER
jgi:hypothetical protein